MTSRIALAVVVGSSLVTAQTPAPAFEVASVKRNVTGSTSSSFRVTEDGSVTLVNNTLRSIIALAYGYGVSVRSSPTLQSHKFVGGPADLLAMRFDITARAPEGSSLSRGLLMLRTLLTERFRLRIHEESRPTPIYAITVAREGALGPNLRPSKYDCASSFEGGTNFNNADAETKAVCWQVGIPSGGVMTSAYAGPLTMLASRVLAYADRPIVDATGLSGNYQWNVSFSMNALDQSSAPSIYTAFEEQLGLKLTPRTAPYHVFVIDSVEMPTAD